MAHPYAEHRQDKVEKSRAASMTKGYASGGAVKGSAQVPPDQQTDDQKKALNDAMNSMGQKKAGGRVHGGKSKSRLDRPHRAKGGRTNGKTNVNIIIAGKGDDKQAVPVPVPAPAAAAPVPPPRPPMMPPGGPPMPPGAMPPGMHASGGRVKRASGGAVKSGPTWDEGRRNGTQVTHSDGKNDTALIDHSRAKLTRQKGGRVEMGSGMGPKMHAGDNGTGRLEKAAMQKRSGR